MKKLWLKLAILFAIVGYLVAIALYFVGSKWHPSIPEVLAICPASALTMISMTDPSFGAIAAIVAPLNAILYGIAGLLIGLGVEGIAKGKSDRETG
jgi:hypothetical protein